jgi:hypothetical protein
MVGDAAFKALTKAQKIAKAIELASGPAEQIVSKYPRLAKFLFKPAAKIAGASVKGAAIGGTMEGVKSGGDVDKTLGGAESGALFGGGTEVTSEIGGALLKKGTKLFKKVADKTLEKPLNELSNARGPALENAVQREQQLAKQLMEEPKQNVTSKSPAVPFDDEYKPIFNEQGPPKLKPEYEEYFKEHGVHHPDVVAAIDNITQEYTQAIKSADSKQASASIKAVKKAMVGLGVDLVAEKVMDDLDWSPGNKWLMRAAIAGTTLHFAKADIANALLKNPKLLVGVAQGTNKVEDVLGAMGTALRNQKVKNAVAGSLYSVNRSDSQGER